jgi:hypothetical protein
MPASLGELLLGERGCAGGRLSDPADDNGRAALLAAAVSSVPVLRGQCALALTLGAASRALTNGMALALRGWPPITGRVRWTPHELLQRMTKNLRMTHTRAL